MGRIRRAVTPPPGVRRGANITAVCVAVGICLVVLIVARLNHDTTPHVRASQGKAATTAVPTPRVAPVKPVATATAAPRTPDSVRLVATALRFAADWGTIPHGWTQARWLNRLEGDGVTGNLVGLVGHMLPQEIHDGHPTGAVRVVRYSPAAAIIRVDMSGPRSVDVTVLAHGMLVDDIEPSA